MVGVFGGLVAHVGRRVPEVEVKGRVFESLGIALLREAAETNRVKSRRHQRKRRKKCRAKHRYVGTHLLKQIVWMSVGERFVDGNIYSTSTPTTKKRKGRKEKEKEGKEGKEKNQRVSYYYLNVYHGAGFNYHRY